ncbi:hypothetical protein IKF04_03215 [Candidatus Saccharibacteria bacterium]|nr:hypothetical protein [Candidatus Saccharibacteria bacterium]
MDLIKKIVEATLESAREKATKIGVSQGAISIMCWPQNEMARDDSGSFFGECVSHTFPLTKEGDTIYRAVGRKEGDCAGVAVEKILAARAAFDHLYKETGFLPKSIKGYVSDSLSEDREGYGRKKWKGAIYFLLYQVGHGGSHCCSPRRTFDYAYIGIGVSGGTEGEDERIILEAIIPAIRKVLKNYSGISLPIPFYSYDEAQ